MNHALGSSSKTNRFPRRRGALWAVIACCASALAAEDTPQPAQPSKADPASAAGDASSRPSAYLIPVALPINGAVDTHVKRRVDQILAEVPAAGARPVLILEFRGRSGQTGEGSEFERCLSLARYLAGDRLGRVRTVAWLPSSVKGHAVLPVTACEEIIVAPDAEFGEAGVNETHIGPTMRRGYSEIAEQRRTIPVAVVLGMLDKELAVYKVQTLDGVRYVLQDELEELQRTATVSSVESIIPPGDLGRFTGRDLRLKFGFASHLAKDREELAAALQLPARAIEEDPSLGGAWTAMRVDVRGPIHAKAVSWIERSIRQSLERSRINFLCVRLESPGGSVTDSLRLANYLASLDPSEVRTVAYVESEARRMRR